MTARLSRLALALLLTGLGGPAGAVDDDATAPAADDQLARLSRRMSERLDVRLRERCLAQAAVAVTVRDLASGRTLYTRGGDRLLVPASNVKLVTAAALLTLLGPERVLHTELRADAAPDDQGFVRDLFLVGRGDPAFTIEAIHLAARGVATAGVRRVGRVVADASYFEGPTRPPTWPERHFRHWYGAPASALNANFNVVGVHVAGTATGAPARAWIDPFPSYFELVNRATTGRGSWSVRAEPAPGTTPGTVERLTVLGRIRPGRSERQLRSVDDPAAFAAHALTESLRRLGVQVEGAPAKGRAPAESVLLHSHPSKPLGLLVHDMNKQSSNLFAEALLRVLGAELLGQPGTHGKGLAVLERFLNDVSPRARATVLVDGSGLSEENRLSTNVLTDVLLEAAADPLVHPEFLVALPIGGVDGTLRRRLDDGTARRLVRAKTGRLASVVALSGHAPVAPGRQAVFSVLVNDYHCATWQVQDAVDAFVESLVADAGAAPEPAARISLDGLTEEAHGQREAVAIGGH